MPKNYTKTNIKDNFFSAKNLAISGIIGALYIVLSLVTFGLNSGEIQFRVSEGLTILPLIFPQSIVGLTVGCFISNLIAGCTLFDIIFGSLITLLASILTYLTKKIIVNKWARFIVGGLFPVVLNAFLLPLIWYFTNGKLEYLYIVQASFLLISQSLSVYAVGAIVYIVSLKYVDKLFKK